jgi:hypothetical protein
MSYEFIHDSPRRSAIPIGAASHGVKKTAHRIRGLDQHPQSQ